MSSKAWLSLYDRLWALFPPAQSAAREEKTPAPAKSPPRLKESERAGEEAREPPTPPLPDYVEEGEEEGTESEGEETPTPEPQPSLYRIPLYILEKSLGDLSFLARERHFLYWSDYKGNLHARLVTGGQANGKGRDVTLSTADGLKVRIRSPSRVTVDVQGEEEPVFCVGASLAAGEPVSEHYPPLDFAPAYPNTALSTVFRELKRAAEQKLKEGGLTFEVEMALREGYVRNNLYDADSPFPCFFADALRRDLYSRYPDRSPDDVNAWILRLQSTVRTKRYDYIPRREELSWSARELLRFETEWQGVYPYRRVCKGIEHALRSFENEDAASRRILEHLAYAHSTGAAANQLSRLYRSWQAAKESRVPAERWIRQQRVPGDKKTLDAFRQGANTLNRYARTVRVYIRLARYRMKRARCAMTMLGKFIEHTENN